MATKLETIEDIEQLKLSEISGKQYMLAIHFEKWYGEYLLWLKTHLRYDLAISFLGITGTEMSAFVSSMEVLLLMARN